MSGSFSGRKEIEGGPEPPLYDEPSAVVNLPQQTSDNKLSTESEPSRLRSEKTQKEGYEPIGELSSSLIEKAKSKKKPTKTAHEKSKMKSKKEKGQKVKRDPTWVWIATIMTLLSLVFCIYSCLVAFTALGDKIASEEFPWLDLEVMLGNE
uniref:Uncharacterized protein n=1 Tax=Meloidogyne javanica TaxID=6303 RepID=A0A915M0N0_MELJA